MFPMLPVSNVANSQLALNIGIGKISTLATFFIGVFFTSCAFAEPAYTNHAGNVASGIVVALDARTATILNAMETVKLPLSIFPESEQRRIAADFVLRQGGGHVDQLRVPVVVKWAIALVAAWGDRRPVGCAAHISAAGEIGVGART